MDIKAQKILLFLCLFTLSNSITLCQDNIKKGFKIGIELKNSITEETGTFNKVFDYTFGGFTAINIYSFSNGSLLFKVELNYQKIHYFERTKYTRIDTTDINWNGLHYTVADEKFSFGVIELGIIPAYHMQINEITSFDFFIGPSFGIGNRELEINWLDKNRITYDPFDEYTWGYSGYLSMSLGMSFYYKPIIIDIRYKDGKIMSNSERRHNLSNIYFQFGIAL